MNVKELLQRLEQMDLPNNSYSVLSKVKDEALCMLKEKGIWEVFYSERGLKTNLQTFESEFDACDHFFERITKWFSKKPDQPA